MVTIRNYQMYSACIATAGLYKNTKNTKHELVTFRNCPGLCPAILPKIIWSCQTANRGSKKCNMQYDGCLPLCKKIASDSKQKENGQYVQKSSGNCLFTVGISLYSPSWDIVLPTYTLNLAFQLCFESKLVLICWKTWNLETCTNWYVLAKNVMLWLLCQFGIITEFKYIGIYIFIFMFKLQMYLHLICGPVWQLVESVAQ